MSVHPQSNKPAYLRSSKMFTADGRLPSRGINKSVPLDWFCNLCDLFHCLPLVLVEARLGKWRLHIICDYVPLAGTFCFLFTFFLPFPTPPILCPSLASVYCLTLLSAGIIEVSHRLLQRCRLFTNQQDFNKGLAVSRKLAQWQRKEGSRGSKPRRRDCHISALARRDWLCISCDMFFGKTTQFIHGRVRSPRARRAASSSHLVRGTVGMQTSS